ncbi:MAG: hypothetical protein U1F10_00685 [Burkholderiales bacterium]
MRLPLSAARALAALALAALAAVLAGCVLDADGEGSTSRIVPDGTNPCRHGELWPHALRSARHPFVVHYRTADELSMAAQVVAHLEAAWDFEIGYLGFPPPLDDGGECGADGAWDVFIWRGKETCFVQVIHEAVEEKYLVATPWGGRRSYMIVDPWGRNGGAILAQTLAHELNHAAHAAEDWYEAGSIFEMTATYVEQYFDDALDYNIADFQQHPEWAPLWHDDYRTYAMYGSGLYLYFLRDRYFARGGTLDPTFAARLWHYARNREDRPLVNRPNVVDAFDALLAPVGETYAGSLVPFARWRWYAGSRDDGAHFQPWRDLAHGYALLPFLPGAGVRVQKATLADTTVTIDPPLMLTGTAYVEVTSDRPGRRTFSVALPPPPVPGVKWVLQAVPGIEAGTDGEVLDAGAGTVTVEFAGGAGVGTRTLIVTAMPTAPLDPDDRSGERFPLTLSLRP